MTYAMIYLLIGLVSFWPMLKLDKECSEYVGSSRKRIVQAWSLWCLVWALSLVVDGLFWMMDKENDDDEYL